jgi:hypothetical protein
LAKRALLCLISAALLFGSRPAFAQAWNNDVRTTQFLDASYDIDPKWRLNLYSELREDRNVSRFEASIFRPNIQYEFMPHWRAALGYVQIQPWQPPGNANPDRGPYQDLLYQNKYDKLGVFSRLRLNEMFADKNSAVWITTAFLVSITYPIADSPWFFNLSDEVYVALKTEYTGHKPGFAENKTFVGVGYPITPNFSLTGGYELAEANHTTPMTLHAFKLGALVHF